MNNYVYTAITGGKDTLKENQNTTGAKFVAFTDFPFESKVWERRDACNEFTDPVRNAKKHKILPHLYFPDAEYSLWIDGSISLKVPLDDLIHKYLQNTDIAMFPHPYRNCLYDEALTCITLGLDNPDTIKKQVEEYNLEGYLPRRGLFETTVILRRHTNEIRAFNETWWDEIVWGSRRDQISLPYVLHKTATDVAIMEGYVHDEGGNKYFGYEGHLK